MEEVNNTDVNKAKKQMSYQNGKIYVIRSYQTNDVYIGSTTQPLSKRFATHLGHFKSQQSKKLYYSSFEILQYGDAYIELLEDYPCDTKEQLLRKEGEHIRATDNCVNKLIAGRTMQEYNTDNRVMINERQKQYYIDNKDIINKKFNVKYSCECGGKYNYFYKSRHFKSIKHNKYINNKNNQEESKI